MSPPDPSHSPAPLSDVFPPGSFAGLTPERANEAALFENDAPPAVSGGVGSGLDFSLFAGMRQPPATPAAAVPAPREPAADGPISLLAEADDDTTPAGFAETAFSLQKLAASLVDGPPPGPAREAVRPTPAPAPPPVTAPVPPVAAVLSPPLPRVPLAAVVDDSMLAHSEEEFAPDPLMLEETPADAPAELLETPKLFATPFSLAAVAREQVPVPAADDVKISAPPAAAARVESPFLDSPAFQPPPRPGVPHPLFLPLASAAPTADVSAHPEPASDPERPESATGLLLGGALLVLAGTGLACLIPLRVVEAQSLLAAADAAAQWTRQSIEFSVIALGAGAVACLAMGLGSAAMRRWAPPLIHAAAWVAVLITLFLLAGLTAAIFHIEDISDLPARPLWVLAAAGLGVPLALIAYYQQDRVAILCDAADPAGRPVPHSAVPARMVLVSSLLLAVLSAAMLRHQPAFPWFGEIRTGENAAVAWISCAAFFGLTALLTAARSAAGWWLLLLGTLALATNAVLTFRVIPFLDFLAALGRPADPLPALPGPVEVWIVLPFLPLLLILLMSRRAFADAPSDPSPLC